MKAYPALIPILWVIFLLPGCASVMSRLSSPLLPPMTQAFFSECDPEIARQAMPSNLKLLEGLLASDPSNKAILKALCSGYAGYALLFLEDEAPERAAALYLRARDYGLRSMGEKGKVLMEATTPGGAFLTALGEIKPDEAEALFWTAVAWSGWISCRGDDPGALARMGVLRACIDRVIELDPDMYHGLAYALSATVLAALPPVLGGDPEAAKRTFERSVTASQGKALFPKYLYARYGAVRMQDRRLFESLLNEIRHADPAVLPETCLLNQAAKIKGQILRAKADELFY